MSTGLKANSDGSAAIQVGGTDVITLTSGGAATFVTSPTTVQAGTAAAPSITFSGDTNTGIYSPGADTIAFTEGGVESMRITSSGNLGLGVTPSAWGTTQYKAAQIGNGGFIAGRVASGDQDKVVVGANAYNDGTNWRYIATDNASYYLQTGSGHYWYNAPSGTAGNTITFTQAMTLDASGNLGIGSTPSTRLDIVATNDTNGFTLRQNATYNAGTEFALKITENTGVTLDCSDAVSTARAFIFTSGGSERARITSGGNLWVNATAAIVNSSEAIGAVALNSTSPAISGKNSAGATSACIETWNNATSGNNLFIMFSTETAYTTRGNIDYNRGAGQVRYNATSDATLKNIIGDSDGQRSLQILSTTRIREYAWKDDDQQKPQIGVIAQELYETYKGAVSVGGDIEKTDEEGNITTEYRPWGVDKTAFTFHLIAGWQAHEKMIKEQQAMIDELKAKVAALEGA